MNASDTRLQTYEITLEPSGKTIIAKEGQTLLDAAIRSGVQIPYGCRHGSCSACKALVTEGEYELMDGISEYSLMRFERDEGYVLLCSTFAESDMVIEVDMDESDAPVFAVHDFEAKVTANVRHTPDIHVIEIRLDEPQSITYTAGQFFEFDIPGLGATRAYSMANPYREGNLIELHVKRVKDGKGSNYLCDLQAGDKVTGSGPYGKMHLGARNKDLLFVAGGSGMAPIKALIEELFSQPYTQNAWFFYGARTKQDLYLMDEWMELEKRYPNFRFIPALSEHDPNDEWDGEQGYIADIVKKHVSAAEGMEAFLCGPPILIETTTRALTQLGMDKSDISFDEF